MRRIVCSRNKRKCFEAVVNDSLNWLQEQFQTTNHKSTALVKSQGYERYGKDARIIRICSFNKKREIQEMKF